MIKPSDFTIYNASAGSGKTYTLVKAYLKIVLSSKSQDVFKRILAITFTNKAVAEMKSRIIDTLKTFSDTSILKSSNNAMFVSLCSELNVSPEVLHLKSKVVLDTIIHNYAAFDISTIDGFTHRIIRTFAYDLKLPLNFEVELDQDALLNEAVDSLINKAGTDKQLTNILVDFAIEKADDDMSWDVSFDFNKIAKLLVNENDFPYINQLKDKTLDDFKALKTQIKKELKHTEHAVAEASQSALSLIGESGLEFSDFSGSYLPNHFQKLSAKNFEVNFTAKWQVDLENKTLYPKRVTEHIALTIEQIQPQIVSVFNKTKQGVFHYKFLKAFYKNITPLSVLNAINKELTLLKEEQNKMLISEFNSIISQEIKDQPTPFIYERIGEKFKHYFIDEFQDTSVKQWENLIPLVSNALSAENGSLMLVGDAKQAIYRWRGGKAEQFINLFNADERPFHMLQNVNNLDTNYRSFKEVVQFNNGLFSFVADVVFQNKDYAKLYERAHQNPNSEKNGYVELTFLDIDKDEDRDDAFTTAVLNSISGSVSNGFEYADITVLVRKKSEGVAVANCLSENNIPILSSETLLIANSPEVTFVNNILTLLVQPENNEVKIEVLYFLSEILPIEDKHQFFVNHISLSIHKLFFALEGFDIYLDGELLSKLPLYDLVETITRSFNLIKHPNAYLQGYLDVVLDFYHKKGSSILEFLDFFSKKKDTLSIVSPEGKNAVQIMTIHKAKGLEFNVVIFPYADLDIYKDFEHKEWFSINESMYAGFSHTLLNFSSDFEHFGVQGLELFNKHKSQQELDNMNLLYVALTRAKEQLYIISKNDNDLKEGAKSTKYSGLLINYLKHLDLWDDTNLTYSFGSEQTKRGITQENKLVIEQRTFVSNAKEDINIKIVTKSGTLWNTEQQEAIEKGNLIHDILAKILTGDDIDRVLEEAYISSEITASQKEAIKTKIIEIVHHPELHTYYTSEYTIYNERDIITKTGEILRPDRLVLNEENKTVVIMDYKTGEVQKNHQKQLFEYQRSIEDMGYVVIKKILIYVNDTITASYF
ncbi:ATP-dependent exoDNAse (exonuclease V) beta subunit (contains helicase and exonuclease domains) [Hyunsoonleella jejuensis]|uniref:DNA 3'-5' helicase n=1 Tax=Hyunsoonleella jejuensis TaxID=419940 RepID=A0A1H9BHY5_9FLAO|nr:UvrD-helicase domain-containing protein [Hyunsoonleella jejuensis]SEP88233.1 ATP-dependent exoDNAse (exonuclease V) beta subunit (contains helicase and exonuclease domains) [Hyunsoonleella jejuensis]